VRGLPNVPVPVSTGLAGFVGSGGLGGRALPGGAHDSAENTKLPASKTIERRMITWLPIILASACFSFVQLACLLSRDAR